MKRENLFRIWDMAENCYLPEDVYCILNKTEFSAFGKMIKDWRDYRGGEYFYDDSQILEQFTGLTDKNGVKIFEGDIVRWDDNSRGQYWRVGAIKWVKSHYQIAAYSYESNRPSDKWYSTFNFGYFAYESDGILEIIGNIHNNPELLK